MNFRDGMMLYEDGEDVTQNQIDCWGWLAELAEGSEEETFSCALVEGGGPDGGGLAISSDGTAMRIWAPGRDGSSRSGWDMDVGSPLPEPGLWRVKTFGGDGIPWDGNRAVALERADGNVRPWPEWRDEACGMDADVPDISGFIPLCCIRDGRNAMNEFEIAEVIALMTGAMVDAKYLKFVASHANMNWSFCCDGPESPVRLCSAENMFRQVFMPMRLDRASWPRKRQTDIAQMRREYR